MSATSVAFALVGTAFMLIWSTVMYAHVDEHQRRAAYRDLIARAAIRRRHDRELAEIRYYLQALDHVVRPLSADTTQPATQPIVMPTRDDGPPTEPAEAVFVIAKAVGARQPNPWPRGPVAEQNARDIEAQIHAIRARTAQRAGGDR